MTAAVPITINVRYGDHLTKRRLTIPENGFLTLLGPNASGKSHILRALRDYFKSDETLTLGRQVRLLASGRLSNLESYRILHHANQALKVSSKYVDEATPYPDSSRYFVETLAIDYQSLKARPDIQLKIRARLKEFFNRDIDLAWEAGGLAVNFVREDSQGERYGIGREASGLIHLVGLLAAIYNDTIGVLLIDEPELSLHPQYQNFLLEEIRRYSGIPAQNSTKKIIIIATHSEELIHLNTPEDLKSLGFCMGLEHPVHQFLDFHHLEEQERLENLISRLSSEFKRAFFADHILLLEGPTDEKICHTLNRKLELSLTARGVELLPLLGKGDFIAAHKLLELLKKEVSILADLDWIIDAPEWVDQFLNRGRVSQEVLPPERRFHFKRLIDRLMQITFNPKMGLFQYFQEHVYYSESFDEMITYLSQQNRGDIESFNRIRHLLIQQQKFSEDQIKKFLIALRRIIVCREIERAQEAGERRGLFKATWNLIHELQRAEAEGIYLIWEGELEACYFSNKRGSKTVRVNEEMIAIQRAECDEVSQQYRSILRALNSFVIDDSSAELRLLYDELDSLANNIRRFYETNRISEIRNLFYQTRQEGIFQLNLDEIRQRVSITIVSNILVLTQAAGALVINRGDDANEIARKVELFVYQEQGGHCDSRLLDK